MRVPLSESAEHLRDEASAWLEEHLIGDFKQLIGRGGPSDEELWELNWAWEQELGAGGWIGLSWPKEYGGRGATLLDELAFNQVYASLQAPGRVSFMGENIFGPALIRKGSSDQVKRWLPGILKARDLWCQGFSEPNAGSDLGNIRTSAVRDGDEWVVTGAKIWTTLAHRADWCFVLCRTGEGSRGHAGLTCMAVPMHQDAIQVKRIRQITGSQEFCEVSFNGAQTSKRNVIGAEGDGWSVAMATLEGERSRRLVGYPAFDMEMEAAISFLRRSGAASDPIVRQRISQNYTQLQVMKMFAGRVLAAIGRGESIGTRSSLLKLAWSEWHQGLYDLLIEVERGYATVPGQETTSGSTFLYSRAETIFAGTSEIQRNILAERLLGLPKT